MSVDELLKPRYKQIADYPNNKSAIGRIFGHNTNGTQNVMPVDEWIAFHEKYPAIYKKLFWYEEREESEMPEYVCFKTAIPLTYKKVTKWWLDADKNWWADYDKKSTMLNMWAIEPATEKEYTDYLTQINKK